MCFKLTSPLVATHRQFAKVALTFQCRFNRFCAIYVRIAPVNGILHPFSAVTQWLTSSYYVPTKELLKTFYVAASHNLRFRVPKKSNKKARTLDKSGRIPSPLPPRKELYEQNTI